MDNQEVTITWGEEAREKPQMQMWMVHVEMLDLWYGQNSYYHSDFKPMLI